VKSIENWSVPDRPLDAPSKGKEKGKPSLLDGSDR